MSLPDSLKNTLNLPVVVAPMFLVSNPELVVAACRAGVVGSFPALNQRSSAGYEEWLQQIQRGLAASENQDACESPYAVNLIVHKTNKRLMQDLELTVKYKVPVVITSLGASKEVVDAVHSYGGLIFHDVVNMRFAEKALSIGVDGVIAVCAGAGGHAGTYNPFAFISELRAMTDKTILAGGCISNGASIMAAQCAGADLAYMGTRFIPAFESTAQSRYKQMIIDSSAKDIVYTAKISGVPASFLAPSIVSVGLDLNQLETPDMNVAEDMDIEAKAWKDIWSAGQGVGGIRSTTSVDEIYRSLTAEYLDAAEEFQVARQYFKGIAK